MKTIIAAFFASCVVSLAQPTNVDPSTGMPQWRGDGKITNTNLLAPVSFTNSIGNLVIDAIPARLFANKLIYITTNGGGGTIRLEKLPPDLQEKFGYNPIGSKMADESETTKKVRDQQIRQQQMELAEEQMRYADAVKKATARKYWVEGRVIQKIDAGLLVSWNLENVNNVPIYRTVLLKDYPKYESTAADDYIEASAMPVGLYTYTTVNKSENTIHVYTCSTNAAALYYSTH